MLAYSGLSDALIRCLSNGRSATEGEVYTLARRIWTEIAPFRTPREWSRLEDASPERQAALRSATIALNGCGSV